MRVSAKSSGFSREFPWPDRLKGSFNPGEIQHKWLEQSIHVFIKHWGSSQRNGIQYMNEHGRMWIVDPMAHLLVPSVLTKKKDPPKLAFGFTSSDLLCFSFVFCMSG